MFKFNRDKDSTYDSESVKKAIFKLGEECKKTSDSIKSEEATKVSLILPLIQELGYNVRDPHEVVPEFDADIKGIKRGEKVDFAIIIDDEPTILIEAKKVGSELNKAISQLYRYFSVTDAKVGIVTDGIKYLFFTDSMKSNVMDTEPYLYINMSKLTNADVDKLVKYSKHNFNEYVIRDHIAYERLYSAISNILNSILEADVDPIFLTYIEENLGVNFDDTDVINCIIRDELENIAMQNEIIARTLEAQKIIQEGKKVRVIEGESEANNVETRVKVLSDIDTSQLYTIGSVDVQGHKIEYAMIFGNKYEGISYANLLIQVLNNLYDMGSHYIDKLLIDEDFKKEKYTYITKDRSMAGKPRELGCGGVYVHTYMGSEGLVGLTMQILDKCGIDYNNVRIKFNS